jgi:hypothetical protein
LPNRKRLKISPQRHNEFVASRKCWDRHQLIAPDVKQTLNDSDFENFPDAYEEHSIDHMSRGNEIRTNRFDWFEKNEWDYEEH